MEDHRSRRIEYYSHCSTRSANLPIFPRIVPIQIIVQLSQVSPTSSPFFEINTRRINFPRVSPSVNIFCKLYYHWSLVITWNNTSRTVKVFVFSPSCVNIRLVKKKKKKKEKRKIHFLEWSRPPRRRATDNFPLNKNICDSWRKRGWKTGRR